MEVLTPIVHHASVFMGPGRLGVALTAPFRFRAVQTDRSFLLASATGFLSEHIVIYLVALDSTLPAR